MFTATKASLSAALALTGDIVESRNTIPILSNVCIRRAEGGAAGVPASAAAAGEKLKGGADKLVAHMTDLDIEARIVFSADIQPAFQGFTVPARLLREIVGKLADGADISVAPADARTLQTMVIKSGRSRFSLQVLPERDFPDLSMTEASGHLSATLDAKALAEGLSAVAFAISTEETRYYLNGVFAELVEDGLLLVATDGHRLAKRFVRTSSSSGSGAGIIIPRKTVGVLRKILPRDGELTMEATDSLVRFVIGAGATTITSKLVDGTFPDYRRVIPAHGSNRAEIEAKSLRSAVDRVSTVSSERGRAARFAFAAGTLTLTVNSPDSGSAEEALAFDGDAEIETGFNAKYVLDALTHLADGTVIMTLEDAASPAILRADGDHADNLIVLMPMRV